MDIVNSSESVTLPAFLSFLPHLFLLVEGELGWHVNVAQFFYSSEVTLTGLPQLVGFEELSQFCAALSL